MTQILPRDFAFLAPIEINDLIRIGNSNDGGYVVPEALVSRAEVLLSFGVCNDWTFEEDFRRRNSRVVIHAYDHTVSEWIFKRKYREAIFNFCLGRGSWREVNESHAVWRSYIQFFSSCATHFEEQIHPRFDYARFATLDKVFARTDSMRAFLKIDIEGAEYGIVNDLVRYASRIEGLVIEFHETMALRETFCSAIHRLQNHFHIVHIHPNNYGYVADDGLPETLEITFAPGVAPKGVAQRLELPLADLDRPNKPSAPELPLRFAADYFNSIDQVRA